MTLSDSEYLCATFYIDIAMILRMSDVFGCKLDSVIYDTESHKLKFSCSDASTYEDGISFYQFCVRKNHSSLADSPFYALDFLC